MSEGSQAPTAFQATALSALGADEKDACCNKGNGVKSHPIFEAVKSGKLIPVQTLVEQQGLSVLALRDDKGHTPAHWACLGGHTSILRYMIENKVAIDEASSNELGAHPVHWACVNGHIAVVDILTQVGVDLDVTDNKHCTPLIVAAQYGQTMLAGYLMGKGARLQLTDKDGDNALHWAAFKGHNELMRLLIYSGFNPRQKDNYGQTALHLACINGNLTAVRELCEQDGVEIDLADNNGKTPLMLALGRKHDPIVAYLKTEVQTRNSLLPRIDCWAIIFGPPGNSKGALLFFLFNVVFWGYPMYIFKCLPVTWYDLQIFHILFMFINVAMWVCLYHANTIDPGYLPRNIPEYDLAIKQVAHFDEWKQGQNPLSRLCHTCRTVKPLRAKHCRVCNRCVKEFDHHCPYIHNCVGYYNRVWFVAFLGCLTVLVSLSDFFCYYIMNYVYWDWLMIIGAVELCIFSVVIGVVATMSISHAAQNITTNERINKKRYAYLKDGKGAFYNPFDRGAVPNLMEFLHLKRAVREDEVHLLGVHVV
ncbi:probable protein S-acyltransferase 23 [Aplysia californica]|uniref:Palmitoyltransferase n=1 Tax=Aplysia californica TaxID=6500 RepID=A0ABM1A081_APLCA|nr:probable protein S-acyltransferase 23 [Aplysia californica]